MKFSVVISLLFVFKLVASGPFPNQTGVRENFDCNCTGYEVLAKQCNWKRKICNESAKGYQNYLSYCISANLYLQDRREGNTQATYDRVLTCDSNISQRRWKNVTLGVLEVDDQKPSPSSVNQVVDFTIVPKQTPIPREVSYFGTTTPIKAQGRCSSCWAFVSTALCEWWKKNKTPPSVILSVNDSIQTD